jgi:hypothetical protein
MTNPETGLAEDQDTGHAYGGGAPAHHSRRISQAVREGSSGDEGDGRDGLSLSAVFSLAAAAAVPEGRTPSLRGFISRLRKTTDVNPWMESAPAKTDMLCRQ